MSEGVSPKIALEIVNKHLEKGELQKAKDFIKNCEFSKIKDDKDAQLIAEFWKLRDLVEARWLKEGESKNLKNEEPDIFDFDKRGNKKINVENCANYLINKFIFKTISERNDFKTFIFQGNYNPVGNGFIKVQIEELIKDSCNNYLVSEILSKIQRKTFIEREEFEKVPINIIPFENGGYNLTTQKLEEFKPEWNFKTKLNAKFIKGASCKEFKKYIQKTLYPEDLDLMQELFGFCLYRKYFLKKGFIFVGDKNTGKTTLINILVALIGIKNCSGLSLQKIGIGKPFDLCSLYNKYLNFYDDLSSKDLIENAGFKIACGGGYITAEKKFGDLFQFMNFAKLIFATNKIPPIKDLDDEAHFIRNIIFQFDNEVSENEIDTNLSEKLSSEKELSGIVNWALEGLKRILKNQKFSYNKSIEEIKSIMCRSGNPLFSFVEDVLQQKEGGIITKEQMFEIYKVYANERKISPLSKEQLGRQLQKIAPWIANKKDNRLGGRIWENVSIVSNYSNKDKIKTIFPTFPTSQENICVKEKSINNFIDMYKNKVGKVSENLTEIDFSKTKIKEDLESE